MSSVEWTRTKLSQNSMDQYNYKYGNGYLDEKKKRMCLFWTGMPIQLKKSYYLGMEDLWGKKREKVWRTAHYAFFGLIGRIVTT